MGRVIDELEAMLDRVAAADPSTLAYSDTIVALHRIQAKVEAVKTRATARWDARAEWSADGARSGAGWLARRCRVPKPAAARTIHLGRALRHLPVAERAWLAGTIDGAHVQELAAKRTDRTKDAMAADEELLVSQAASLRFDVFRKALAYWHQINDDDGAETDAEALFDQRHLHLSRTFRDTRRIDGVLDPIGGSIVEQGLRKIEQELFDTDWAAARAVHGDATRAHHLARSPAQRRADALVEMARRAQATPADGRLPAPLFTVLIDYPTLTGRVCELADGTVLTPGSLLPWLDEAHVERVVFGAPSRVLDVGVRRRLFEGATRRAVQLAGGECYHDYCDLPADRCQIDHQQPYADGGLTTQANGRPACGYHNRLRHQRHPPDDPRAP